MLHILWLIIKFILIALGIVLGLLVLALLLLLFCPVRYHVSGTKEGEGWKQAVASGRVSWLAGILSLKARFYDGSSSFSFCIFGIPLERILQKVKKFKKRGKRRKVSGRKKTDPVRQKERREKQENIPKNTASDHRIQKKAKAQETAKMPASVEAEEKTPQKPSVPIETVSEDSPEKEKTSEKPGFFHTVWDKITAGIQKLISAPEKIRAALAKVLERIRALKHTIQKLFQKADWWKQFLTHPRTKAAISLIWDELKRLLRHVFPTKISGAVTFGNEDPSVTGSVLAVLGVTIPFHKNCIAVTPVFDGSNVLTGKVWMRGRIYGFMLVKAAIKVYFNKNVKNVISRWRHKEDK